MPRIWRNLDKNKNLFNLAAKSRPFIVFDTETTGLKKDDEIIELAACKCMFYNGKFVATHMFHTYIRPSKPVPLEASEVNGLTDEFLSDKPDEETIFPFIYDFFGDSPALGAYNSGFDVRMLRQMYERCGRVLNVALEVDFLKIARDILCEQKMKDHKLGTVANTYGVDEGIEFHSAMDDVRVLIRVMNAMIQDILLNSADSGSLAKVRVYKLNYYAGYRGHSRLYAITSVGPIYYDLRDDKWGSKQDLSKVDMQDMEQQVFQLSKCADYKELRSFCQKELAAKA